MRPQFRIESRLIVILTTIRDSCKSTSNDIKQKSAEKEVNNQPLFSRANGSA